MIDGRAPLARTVNITKRPDVSLQTPWNVGLYENGEYIESHGAESHHYAIACADDWIHGGEGWA